MSWLDQTQTSCGLDYGAELMRPFYARYYVQFSAVLAQLQSGTIGPLESAKLLLGLAFQPLVLCWQPEF